MMRITEAVKNLIIINVLFYLGSRGLDGLLRNTDILIFKAKGSFALEAYYIESEWFRPFQIATHMFMHANLGHLFFNMFGLYMFGTLVENKVGVKNLLVIFFISGLGALLAQNGVYAFEMYFNNHPWVVDASMLGASGAIMGVSVASAVFFPDVKFHLIFPPIPVKLKYLVLAYVVIDLYQGFSGANSGVAHFAHLGGALAGFLIAKFWKPIRYV